MDLNRLSIGKLRTELWTCHLLAEQRCLRKACEWAEDLIFALPEEGEEKLLSKLEKDLNDTTNNFDPLYEHAKACFELQEYDRAAYIIRNQKLKDDKSRFLHYFSLYKAAEKKRIDIINEVSVNLPKKAVLKFNELRDSLERSIDMKEPDGWLLYVYALVLHKFKLHKRSIEVLVRAINLTPINWSAWYILSTIVDHQKTLNSLNLPNHVFKVFFYYMTRLELNMTDSEPWILLSHKETKTFIHKYFKNSLFIKTLLAKSLSQSSEHKDAISLFGQIRSDDPYRVDAMEIYSNALYVRKLRKELARLAYDMERVDPYTPEANSCIANSYSVREQHTKAIVYFTRALRLNPDHLNSWTLIGHEYLEVKSIEKALQAYRYAIFINKRDHRAWLGLGNTFETIMSNANNVVNPNYEPCLYYYSQVGKYRPNDHNMFLAMANIYDKMGDTREAVLCMKRAGKDGASMLEKFYETSGRRENDETQNADQYNPS